MEATGTRKKLSGKFHFHHQAVLMEKSKVARGAWPHGRVDEQEMMRACLRFANTRCSTEFYLISTYAAWARYQYLDSTARWNNTYRYVQYASQAEGGVWPNHHTDKIFDTNTT